MGLFGRSKEEEFDEEEEEIELVLFQGALNGRDTNLAKHARLAEAGLVPAKELLTDALVRRAETVVLDPKGQAARVKLEVDGVPYPGGRMRRQRAQAVTQMMKLLSGLDIQERKRPQSGGLKAELEGKEYVVGVESKPVSQGAERLTLRIRSADSSLETPEALGINDEVKAKIRELSGDGGLLGVCGPPHSGVTTAAIGVLRSIDAYTCSIVTIADMHGREILGVSEFESDPEHDFDATLLRIIRAEHDVVFVDPIRDQATLTTCLKRAEDVTILTEFAARDAVTGVAQLVKWAGDPQLVAERVTGVISQKLVRRLCDECKVAFRPNPRLLSKVGLPKGTKILYRPAPETDEEGEELEPCGKCGGLGYYGRVGMYEIVEMSEAVQSAVTEGAEPARIKAAAKQDDMLTFQKTGLKLVEDGVTSLEELQRAFKAK